MRPFIPSWLDDAGLAPRTFRVLAHLWRRRGVNGRCNPSVASIAAACRLHRDTVWQALAEIERAGLLVRSRKGIRTSNQYDLICPTGGKNQPAGNLAADVGKTGHHMAEKTSRQGYPEKVIREGEGPTKAPSLSSFENIISEVSAMPEFKNRTDVRDIAEIIGAARIRSSAHLARCVRTERHPRFTETAKADKGIPEPAGWRDYAKEQYPEAVFLDPEHERYAASWGDLSRDYQWLFYEEMRKHAAS